MGNSFKGLKSAFNTSAGHFSKGTLSLEAMIIINANLKKNIYQVIILLHLNVLFI